jgi:hypothetical protein
MSFSCVFTSVRNSESTSVDSLFGQGFKAWLVTLQSGNSYAELSAFAALRDDFQKSSQQVSANTSQSRKRHPALELEDDSTRFTGNWVYFSRI